MSVQNSRQASVNDAKDLRTQDHHNLPGEEATTEINMLSEMMEFTQYTIDNSGESALWVDDKGRIIYANNTACRALGYTRKELLKMTLPDIDPNFPSETWGEKWEDLKKQNGPMVFESILITKDGRKIPVEVNVSFQAYAGKEYSCAFLRDITERKKAEEALKESEERFRQMAELLPLTIYEADLEGNITYANLAAFSTSGYSSEDLVSSGVNILNIIAPEEREKAKGNIAKILSGQYHGGTEYTALRKNGSRFPIVIYSSVIMHKNQPIGIRGIVVDITDRKKAEEKEKQYIQHIMETDKMATLGTLVSGIAHEINNPNNAIMFNLHIIKEILDDIKPLLDKRHMQSADFQVGNISYSDLPQSIDRLMKGMNRSSERIKHIVADLRNFAKPSPYNLEQWVQVNEVVRSSIVLLNNMIRVSTDNFSVDYSENLPKIKGNFQRLEQVIINLIQNACQSLENKGQGINVKTTHIREDKKESICITVADEGTGIPEKNLKYITDPFFTTKRDEGGTGLGLSITHRIIKDHNGTLDIQSKPGTGSVFTVNLPVIPSTASKSRRAQNEQ